MKQLILAGREVPAIGIGTWHMGSNPQTYAQELAAIQAGIHAGAKVIDTAEMYGSGDSEALVGAAIAPFERKDLFLISKVLPNNASKKRMAQSLDASLQRLKTDYLDLYLYHWRGGVPLAETVAELQRLQTTGKIKNWGVSNFDTADMKELWQLSQGSNASANEDLYNLGSRGIEYDLLPWQKAHNCPLIAYSPVGAGDSYNGTQVSNTSEVLEVAKRHHVTAHQVMLAWVIRNEQVLAIPQTSNPEHMQANIAAGELELDEADLALLDQAFPAPTRKQPLAIL
ncbi:aldo/keto reductase [Agrilactobacillus yilanensis]|uniref:Aldo/keto reductase n=1 Tax=Agrilactobacillus yilanensis TaxID=2485997 RepID=A0ABW4J685_9LACO|nr:aldo/keto reductase [Agrilactobacillus yilanensis]